MKIPAGLNSPSSLSASVSPPSAPSVEASASNALQRAGAPYFLRLPSETFRGVPNKQPGIFQYLTQKEVNNLRSLSKDRRLDEQALLFFKDDRFSFNMRHFKTNEQLTPFLRYIQDIKTLKITGLNIESWPLLRQSLSELGAEFKFEHMDSLDLSAQEFGNDTFLDIHTHFLSRISSLTSLNLRKNKIGNAVAEAIAGSEQLASLTSLDLGYNGIGADGKKAIRARFPFADVYY